MTDEELDASISYIRKIAQIRYGGQRNPWYDDIIGYGILGIYKAICTYNPSRGEFLKHLHVQIFYAMQTGLRNMDPLDVGTRRRVRRGEQSVTFLDDTIFASLYHSPSVIAHLFSKELIAAVRNAVAALPVQQRKVMLLHLAEVPDVAIAKRIKVSGGRVCQIRTAACKQLRKLLMPVFAELRGNVAARKG